MLSKRKHKLPFWGNWRQDAAAKFNTDRQGVTKLFRRADPELITWLTEQVVIRRNAVEQKKKLLAGEL